MPLTTRNARASVLLLGLPFGRVFADPDGLVAQADRQQAALSYAGLLAGASVVSTALMMHMATTRLTRQHLVEPRLTRWHLLNEEWL